MITEAVSNTKIDEGDGNWLYGPFASTNDIRQWVKAHTNGSVHADRTQDGKIFIRSGKQRIGEQVRGAGGVYIRSKLRGLKAPPRIKKSEVAPAPAPAPAPAAAQTKEPPKQEEPVKQPQPEPTVVGGEKEWAEKSHALHAATQELNSFLKKIRNTFAFNPKTDTNVDEYLDFLEQLSRDNGQFTSRQRATIHEYIRTLTRLEEKEDTLAQDVGEIERSIGGSGVDSYQMAFDAPVPDADVNPLHKRTFTQRLQTALEVPQKQKAQPKKGDTVQFPNGKLANVVRVTDKVMTIQSGTNKLEDIALTDDFTVISR